MFFRWLKNTMRHAGVLDSLNLSGLPPHMIVDQHEDCSNNNVILKHLYIRRALQRSQIYYCSGVCYAHNCQETFPRITIQPSSSNPPFTLKRRQFPVRPALEMTINMQEPRTNYQKVRNHSRNICVYAQTTVRCSKQRWRQQ